MHLWDETVGHYLWYAGFALLVAVLAVTLADRRPRGGLAAHLLAVAVGFTHFTNSVEGQTAYLGIGDRGRLRTLGLQTRDGMGRYLLTSYGLSLAALRRLRRSGRAASRSSASSTGSRSRWLRQSEGAPQPLRGWRP